MAYPATLFGVDTDADLEKLASQLSKFSLFRSEIEFLGKKFQLGLKIENMEKSQNSLSLIVSDSFVSAVKINEDILKLPVTRRTPLSIIQIGADLYLVVFSRKKEAEKLADILSEELFKKPDVIYRLVIPSQALSKIYRSENVEVKQIVYESTSSEEEIKTTVYFGRNLASVLPRGEKEKSIKIKYILYRDEVGVFGISASGTVIAYTQLSQSEFVSYIVEKIIPLAEPPG